MGLLSRVRTLLSRSPRAGVALDAAASASPPALGPSTKRVHGFSAGDWAYAQRQAEKWFGPFNPRHVPDSVLKIMGSDWSIGFAREIWLSAFHSVDYRLEGGSPEIRAFVEVVVERYLSQWIETALRSLDYGRQACELVWSLEDVAYSYAQGPGRVVEATKKGAYILGELRDLDPELVEILADEKTGDYRGLRYQGVELPGSKTLLVTNEPEFGGLLGRSLNVRAYNPWWWGNLVYLGLNRYLERKGDPPIIGFAPGEEVSDEGGNAQDPVRVTAVGLANLRSGGAYVFPQEFDPDAKQPLYSVRTLEVAERAPEFLSTIDRYEHNKRLAWLIPGSLGSGGSFASDKVSQQIVHRMFDRRLRRIVLDPLNLHVVPKLVRFNFGPVPAQAYPRLAAGSMAENAREIFAELLRAALQLEGVAPDGRAVRIAQMIDWCKGLRTLNLPKVDTELIPDPPAAPEAGYPTAGRPPRIAPERDRPNAPGRPGQAALARPPAAVALAVATPEDYWGAVERTLGAIDQSVARAERIAEDHRRAAQEEIRAILRKRLLSARTTETADGREVVSTRNRRLADQVEREVEAVLERILNEDLLDEGDLERAALELSARSPLIDEHVAVAREARDLLRELGIPAPKGAAARRVVGDVIRDGQRNGRGVVVRESRRLAENVDRIVQGGLSPDQAERVIDAYELPRREFVESTVHHVRASARATLGWDGALEAAERRWGVLVGPETEKALLLKAPSGEVADFLYQSFSTRELDELFAKRAEDGLSVSHWRNLGLNYFSREMYVPLPGGDSALTAAILALLATKRRVWNERRQRMQEGIDAKNAENDRELARAREPMEGAALASEPPPPPPLPPPAPVPSAPVPPAPLPPAPVPVQLTIVNQAPAPPPPPPPPQVTIVNQAPAPPPPAPAPQITIVNQPPPAPPAPSLTIENYVAPAEVRIEQPITVQPSPPAAVTVPVTVSAAAPAPAPAPSPIEIEVNVDARGGKRTMRVEYGPDGKPVRIESEPDGGET